MYNESDNFSVVSLKHVGNNYTESRYTNETVTKSFVYVLSHGRLHEGALGRPK